MVDGILTTKGKLDKFVTKVLKQYLNFKIYPNDDPQTRMYNIINDEVRGHMNYVAPDERKSKALDDARACGKEPWMEYTQDDARYFECAKSKYFDANEMVGAIYLNLPDFQSRLQLYKKLIEEYAQMSNEFPYNFKFITADPPDDTRADNFLIYVERGQLQNVCDVLKRTLANSSELVEKLDEPAKSLFSYEGLFSYQPRSIGSYTRKFADNMYWAIDMALCRHLGSSSINELMANRRGYKVFIDEIRDQLDDTMELTKKSEILNKNEREAIAELYYALANQKRRVNDGMSM